MSSVRALATALLAAAVAMAAHAADSDGRFGDPMHFTEADGAAVYGAVCAGCHMPNGRGAQGAGVYPSLAQDPRLAASGYPIGLVLRGRNAMPPFARTLSDAQIAAVVAYVRENFGNRYTDAPTAADVQAVRAAH